MDGRAAFAPDAVAFIQSFAGQWKAIDKDYAQQ